MEADVTAVSGLKTMDNNWMPGAGVGVVGSIFAWFLSWRINSAAHEARSDAETTAAEKIAKVLRESDTVRADDLRREIGNFKDDWKEGIVEVRRLADCVSALQGSQNVFNATTVKALDGIATKIDKHDEMLSDHTATLRLLVGSLDNKKDRIRCDRELGFSEEKST